MSSSPSNPASDLVREAQRLRFADPALEARFREERLASGELRGRVMAIIAVLIVAINGWSDVRAFSRTAPEFSAENFWLRAAVMIPGFLLIALSPLLPGHRRRADWLNAGAIGTVCWGNALIFWHLARIFPSSAFGGQLIGSVMPILVISVFGLPLSFRALLAMIGLTATGIIAWFWITLGSAYAHSLTSMTLNLALYCIATMVLGWWRERGERVQFAQREQVRRLADELARVNAEQNAFMGIAAHDLRAPLATVRGFAELLRAGRLPAGEPQQGALREIEAQSTRMLALVSDYLGAHAATGRAEPPKLARIDLQASARAALARHTPAAAAKEQKIIVAEPGASPTAWAIADEGRLAQVVDNFVTNALKFSPRGASVQLAVTGNNGTLRLAVIDAGPGIAAGERAGLFKMFGRGSARPTGGEASHGFGLAVAKRLAESMGGAVGCTSETGRGATFWIELPAAS